MESFVQDMLKRDGFEVNLDEFGKWCVFMCICVVRDVEL